MDKLSLRDILDDPALRNAFIKDTGIKKSSLEDLLKGGQMETLAEYLADDYTIFYYSTEIGHCEIIAWQGYYFSGSEWDPLDGPFMTLDLAINPLRCILECGDDNDTDSATHTVESKLPDSLTFEIIRRLVSVGDHVEVNGVKYRRTDSGYASS